MSKKTQQKFRPYITSSGLQLLLSLVKTYMNHTVLTKQEEHVALDTYGALAKLDINIQTGAKTSDYVSSPIKSITDKLELTGEFENTTNIPTLTDEQKLAAMSQEEQIEFWNKQTADILNTLGD